MSSSCKPLTSVDPNAGFEEKSSGSPKPTEVAVELEQLRQALAKSRQECDILRKATALNTPALLI